MDEALAQDPYSWLGAVATVIFCSRFYLQWYYSERKGQSVVPVGFWYLSTCGSILFLIYGFIIQSTVGVLSHAFNIIIYGRNLIHIWREQGKLSPAMSRLVHGLIGLVVLTSMGILAYTWFQEFEDTRNLAPKERNAIWLWIALSVTGQGLFACRFIVQWLVTEARRKSVMPVVFWYISIFAAILKGGSHIGLAEWWFAISVIVPMPVYLRNLVLIHQDKDKNSHAAGA